jgi:hypothetical protein
MSSLKRHLSRSTRFRFCLAYRRFDIVCGLSEVLSSVMTRPEELKTRSDGADVAWMASTPLLIGNTQNYKDKLIKVCIGRDYLSSIETNRDFNIHFKYFINLIKNK